MRCCAFPDQMARLRADPAPDAGRRCRRCSASRSPLPFFHRYASEDIEIAGRRFHQRREDRPALRRRQSRSGALRRSPTGSISAAAPTAISPSAMARISAWATMSRAWTWRSCSPACWRAAVAIELARNAPLQARPVGAGAAKAAGPAAAPIAVYRPAGETCGKRRPSIGSAPASFRAFPCPCCASSRKPPMSISSNTRYHRLRDRRAAGADLGGLDPLARLQPGHRLHRRRADGGQGGPRSSMSARMRSEVAACISARPRSNISAAAPATRRSIPACMIRVQPKDVAGSVVAETDQAEAGLRLYFPQRRSDRPQGQP